MIKLFKMIKNSHKNHNLYMYYFDKWATACGELAEMERTLDDKKNEIKELKNKMALLIQQMQVHNDEKINLREEVTRLQEELTIQKKGQFKKGCIPWNKGKKLK